MLSKSCQMLTPNNQTVGQPGKPILQILGPIVQPLELSHDQNCVGSNTSRKRIPYLLLKQALCT